MVHKYIATKLHQALELAGDDPDWLGQIEALPHYVVDPSLADLLMRCDLELTLEAMKEAGIIHLPFPELVLEISADGPRFFFLIAKDADNFCLVQVAALSTNGDALEIMPGKLTVEPYSDGLLVQGPTKTHASWARIAALAVSFALMMLNVQGIDKEVIEPTRLNKGRKASGKPTVPTHTVMRIGHVYDRNGQRVGASTGRHMPVHMRAGHVRHQHYGPGNADTKLIYVPPVLVNFHPGDTARPPKRIIAA